MKIKSGDELNEPYILALAPTANAAFIIKRKTFDSAFGLYGSNYTHQQLDSEKLATFQYLYSDVSTYIINEVSMFGSRKHTPVHFRAQEFASGDDERKFMEGRSTIAGGDWFQLPPVKDDYIFKNNHLDGRPNCAPSQRNDNYRIYFLTEKVRSQSDPKFGEVCDRFGRDEITVEDDIYLKNMIRTCPNENDNDLFKTGKYAIIVTTNEARKQYNQEKISNLLPDRQEVTNISEDLCTIYHQLLHHPICYHTPRQKICHIPSL